MERDYIFDYLSSVSINNDCQEFVGMTCPIENPDSNQKTYTITNNTKSATVITSNPIFNLTYRDTFIIDKVNPIKKFPNFSIIRVDEYDHRIAYVCGEFKKGDTVMTYLPSLLYNDKIINSNIKFISTEIFKYVSNYTYTPLNTDVMLILFYDDTYMRAALILKELYEYTLIYKINK